MSEPVLCQLGQVNLLKEFAEQCEGWLEGRGEALHRGCRIETEREICFLAIFFFFFLNCFFFFLFSSLTFLC